MFRMAEEISQNQSVKEVFLVGFLGKNQLSKEKLSAKIEINRLSCIFSSENNNRIMKILFLLEFSIRIFFFGLGKKNLMLNCHSVSLLPISVILKFFTKCLLIYDTHELETETHSSRGIQGFMFKISEKMCIKYCNYIFTVNSEIANWYYTKYKLKVIPFVVRNFSDIDEVQKKSVDNVRKIFRISEEDVILLYIGVLSSGRGIELILDNLNFFPNKFKFLFVGYGALQHSIELACSKSDQVFFLPAVSRDRILSLVEQCDIGLSLIENISLSYYLSLPNKFSEYIVGGIPVLASRFPAMQHLIDTKGVGWSIEPSVTELVSFLESLSTQDYLEKKKKCQEEKNYFSWQSESKVLKRAYETILSSDTVI
jgi:glycosyltransferase involved in cell wall biosynthesis